ALPLTERRRRLEQLFARVPADGTLRLSPVTADRAVAGRWLAELGAGGLDGVVAKRADAAYASGERTAMRKVKRMRTVDCVVGEGRCDHFSAGRFRHGTKFLRWRPDKAPRVCTFAQVEGGSDDSLAQFWGRRAG